MQLASTYLIVASVIAAGLCIWAVLLFGIRKQIQKLIRELHEQASEMNENLIIDPQSCVYRGADSEYGNVKGNGVIALTDKRIMFKKLTGQRVEIERSHISKISVANNFKGETAFATKGKHLNVETSDGNRIGFLVKNAERWKEKLRVT